MIVRTSFCALALVLTGACDNFDAPGSSPLVGMKREPGAANTEKESLDSDSDTREQYTVARRAELCPEATVLDAMDSSKDLSGVGPFDLRTFTYAKATRESAGEVNVYISNQDRSLQELQGVHSLDMGASDAVVKLTFSSQGAPFVRGVFATAHEGKARVRVTLFVKDMILAVGLGDSSAELFELRGGLVCGTFDLRGKKDFGHGLSHFAGSFIATV